MFGDLQQGAETGVKKFDGQVERARWMGAKWQLGLPMRDIKSR